MHAPDAGSRLLLTAALLEAARLAAVRWLYPAAPLWLLLPILLGIGLLAVPGITGVTLRHLGFRRWRDWTAVEKSYFCQVTVIANVVFLIVLASALRSRLAEFGLAWSLWHLFVPYFFFGFYQELVYRGMVQLELARRYGAPVGIVVANVLYTFGPLHWNYFASPASVAMPMFAAIFAIGLYFGVAYHRSGNLWIVAVFHGIGNAYMVGAMGPVR